MTKRTIIGRAVRRGISLVKTSLRYSLLGERIAALALRDFHRALYANFQTTGARICLRSPQVIPELTVIFIVHDQMEITLSSLQSLAQADLGAIEFVWVTAAFSRSTKRLITSFPDLKRVEWSDAQSEGDALNRAVSIARGKYVLFFRDGVAAASNTIDCVLGTIRNLPDSVGAVGGMVIDSGGKTREAGVSIHPDGTLDHCTKGNSPLLPEYQFRRPVTFFVDALLLTRRDQFVSLGGFDSQFSVLRNADYCLRLWRRGLSVVYEPTLSVVDLAFPPSNRGTVKNSIMQQEAQRLLATHRDWVQGHLSHTGRSSAHQRCLMDNRKRILFIEDRVPHPYLGRGYPRCHLILLKLLELGYFVSLYPVVEPVEDWSSAYSDLPRDVEILLGLGKAGLPQLLRDRLRTYDLIFVSRPHNMADYKNALGSDVSLVRNGPKVIYDAEALFTLRQVALMKLTGQSLDDDQIEIEIADEVKLADGCYSVISVSDAEGEQFSRRGVQRVHTLGHATPLSPTPDGFEKRRNILFVGALPDAACPNAEGLIWFCGEVLPLLQLALGNDIKLLVAGVNNLQRQGPLASDSVVFLGIVPDLSTLYNETKLFVAPIRFAAGIPLKIYEASAHGLPVVATTILAAQLNWKHERELLVANSAETFAHECAKLYQDPILWERLRSAALARIGAEGSTDAFALKLKAIVESAIGKPAVI